MYIPPLNEFSNLNYQQKIHIVENIQKMIEDNKKNYLKKYNDEILISSYYPKYNESYKNNENDKSSSLSSDDSETQIDNDIFEKARNNIINVKKDYEKFKSQFYLYKFNENKKINKIKETIPDQEINYIIESTNNNNDDESFNNNNNNYNNSKYDINNISFSTKNIIPLKKSDVTSNRKNIINQKDKNNKSKTEKCKIYKNGFQINTIKRNNINYSSSNITQQNNKNIFQTKSQRYYIKSTKNIKENNKFNDINNIKKKLNFGEISNNKNKKNLIRTISCTHRRKINPKDISNRLYNMQQIIDEKINRKKKELEEEEMKKCSFIPKINQKSRRMVEKYEKGIKNVKFKKINVYNFYNKKY